MPLLLIPLGLLAFGGAAKMTGDGIEDAGKGARDLAVAVAVVGGLYLVAKKQGYI